MSTIDRDADIPLYYQLKQIITQRIEQGVWQPGDLIPTELELQESFGLSRTTVRQALGELTQEGRLLRRRGAGTIVAPPQNRVDPDRHLSLSEYLRLQGRTPSWQLLDQLWVPADETVAESLAVAPGTDVYSIHRLRLADEEPLGIHRLYVPEDVASHIDMVALRASASLHYLKELPAMLNSRAFRSIQALPAGPPETEYLKIPPGTPVLLIERTIVSETHRPLEFLRAVYRGDRFQYQITGT